MDFVSRHDIDLYLVNLAENPISRKKYSPCNTEEYYELIADCFGEKHVANGRLDA